MRWLLLLAMMQNGGGLDEPHAIDMPVLSGKADYVLVAVNGNASIVLLRSTKTPVHVARERDGKLIVHWDLSPEQARTVARQLEKAAKRADGR